MSFGARSLEGSAAQGSPGHTPAAWLLLCLLASCKPAVRAGEPVPPAPAAAVDAPWEEPWDEPAPPPVSPEEPPVPLPEPAHTRRGSILRTALHTVLDRGPGAFLRSVSLKPRFRERRFAGWEIVAITTGEAPLDRVDLRPGDVVASINGRPIARPRHLSDLWAELRSADAIVVSVERAGQPFELRFEVVDDNPALRDIVPP